LTDDMVFDKEKGELRFLGQRQAAVEAQSLCDHLDSLVGIVVAEVIMNNLETRLGKKDGMRVREMNPKATVDELVQQLAKVDLVTGMGLTKVSLPEDPSLPTIVEISNPIVKGSRGASKSFLFSWWAGALSSILDSELEARTVNYDEQQNTMRCEIVRRKTS
jgi:hypothetical protein